MKKNKKKYKINYSEGDCFLFPLTDGGFARGIVCRMDKQGGLLGYFYGPLLKSESEAVISEDLKPENAVYIHMCGDLGLVDEKYGWKVIGSIPGWKKEDWPMPVFGSVDTLRNRGEMRFFDENTLQWLHQKTIFITVEEAKKLPGSGLGGCGFIEKQVSKILREREKLAEEGQ